MDFNKLLQQASSAIGGNSKISLTSNNVMKHVFTSIICARCMVMNASQGVSRVVAVRPLEKSFLANLVFQRMRQRFLPVV